MEADDDAEPGQDVLVVHNLIKSIGSGLNGEPDAGTGVLIIAGGGCTPIFRSLTGTR